jgi:phosphomannomutase
VVRSPVGEANVVAAMRAHQAVLAGEGNGGIIDPRVVQIRDSLIGMALILQLLAENGRPLSAIVATLPHYEMIKQKVSLAPERIEEFLQRVKQASRDGVVDERDGIRVDWPEGWALVRPSNTEPIVRLTAEAATRSGAEQLIARVRASAAFLLTD